MARREHTMAQDNNRMITGEDTVKALIERSKEGDDFTVKVLRRAHLGSPPSLVATLSGAVVQHFTSPELWLPPLCGGGKYMLQGYHATDLAKPVGGFIQLGIDNLEPREVSADVVKRTDWRGPPNLEYPQKDVPRQTAEDLGPLYTVRSPTAPGAADSATRSPQGWSRQAVGGHRQDYAENGTWADPRVAALESERRSLEAIKLELEKQKHADKLESLKKDHEADMKALKTELLSAIGQSKPSGPDPTMLMMQEMMKQAAEDRRADAQRAAEDRRAAAERQDRADARQAELMAKMFERPKEKDPLDTFKAVAELLNSKKDTGMFDAQSKIMHSMSEMVGQQMNVAMDFVNAAAEMQLGAGGKDEPAWVKGVDKLMKGIGAMAKASTRGPIPQPPQLAAQTQPQVPPTFEQQARQPPPPPQQAKPPEKETDVPVIVQIEQAIRAKLPVTEIAKALIAYYKDPSLQEALAAAGGDFEAALHKRLGNWHNEAPSNAAYLSALWAEVEKQLTDAGIIGDDDDEEGDEEDDAAEGSEEHSDE